MKKLNEMITKENMQEVVKFHNELAEWVFTDWEYNSIERQWCINLVQHLNHLKEEYKNQTVDNAEYFVYYTRQHFDNVKELYRNNNELKYKKVYGAWEILFDAGI